jgi:branched-chain amino acid transport system ATP-binding protein
MLPILETRDLTKSFGGIQAIAGINLQVSDGEIVGLIGPNGAGKTTFFNVVTGFFRPTSGGVLLGGRDVSGWKPHRIAKSGMVRTFQTTTLFKESTVAENMLLGFHMHLKTGLLGELFRTSGRRQEQQKIRESSTELLEFMGLAEYRKELVKNIPYGHQRALGISLALAAGPRLLLLDESVSGMNSEEIDVMMKHILRISREMKIAVMVVEHNMKVVMGICSRIIVLNFGTKIAEGSPREIMSNKMVIQAYLGAEEDGDVAGN